MDYNRLNRWPRYSKYFESLTIDEKNRELLPLLLHIASFLNGAKLFPDLVSLSISIESEEDPSSLAAFASFLGSGKLKELRLSGCRLNCDDINITDYLAVANQRVPSLEELSIICFGSIEGPKSIQSRNLPSGLEAFTSLRKLTLTSTHFTRQVADAVSHLPLLQRLELPSNKNSRNDGISLADAPNERRNSGSKSKMWSFPSLSSFEFITSGDNCTKLFDIYFTTHHDALEELKISFKSSFSDSLMEVISATFPNLRRLEVNPNLYYSFGSLRGEAPRSTKFIRPLMRCSLLEELSLDRLVTLHDHDLPDLLSSWPNLRDLSLRGVEWSGRKEHFGETIPEVQFQDLPGLTLSSLLTIMDLCQKMKKLRISLVASNTENLNALVNNRKRPGHKLQFLHLPSSFYNFGIAGFDPREAGSFIRSLLGEEPDFHLSKTFEGFNEEYEFSDESDFGYDDKMHNLATERYRDSYVGYMKILASEVGDNDDDECFPSVVPVRDWLGSLDSIFID